MNSSHSPISQPPSSRLLSTADFPRLAVPLVDNGQTRRAYLNAVEDFMKFPGNSFRSLGPD